MIKEMNGGLVLSVKVIPNAKKNEVVGVEAEELKIRIAAVPDKGRANSALIDFLAKLLKIGVSQVSLVKGDTSRHKKILIKVDGLSIEALERDLLNT